MANAPAQLEVLCAAPVGSLDFRRALVGAGRETVQEALAHSNGRARKRRLAAALRRMDNVRVVRAVFFGLNDGQTAGRAA
jgi:hypothetical protein